MLHVIGIRHHSPACARLVAHVIERVRPAHVLIEGPADMNARMDELRLAHAMPVAIFTFLREEPRTDASGDHPGRRHASWTPFCSYSPEWVALTEGTRVGAEVRFCDLPAWDPAFEGRTNRYADQEGPDAGTSDDPNARVLEGPRTSKRYGEALCKRYGVDDIDTLWDHLFEGPVGASAGGASLDELAHRLATYFEHLRNDEPGGPRDAPREELMSRFAAWAVLEGSARSPARDVVLVCGGFHAPFVEKRTAEIVRAFEADGETMPMPVVAQPSESARFGSYLVPYTYRRLDAFAGYDAGMPSPGFYELVFERGAEHAAERLLEIAVERLRKKKQLVSTADLIAARTLAEALRAMRGHAALLRTDLLDALASALVKDGLDAPLPWARRGPMAPRTDPLLVEIVSALSGEREGRLDPRTPRPPLVFDVEAELAKHDLVSTAEPRTVKLSLRDEAGRARSRVLHRLSVLAIPGYVRASGPRWATDTLLDEVWALTRSTEQHPALIEASIWGATLESAALARLEDALVRSGGKLAALTEVLGAAVFVGIGGLAMQVIERVESAIANEHALGDVGTAISRLFDVFLHGELLGAQGASALERVLAASLERGLWLLEGVVGPTAPLDEAEVRAVAAMRDVIVRGPSTMAAERGRAEGVFGRRALDPQAPPGIRGAALGALWSLAQGETSEEREALAVAATKGASLPTILGDFLGGLFVVARAEALHADGLLAAIDEVLVALDDHDVLVGLPSLRLAFSFFPPREREAIAKKILARHGRSGTAAHQMLKLRVAPRDVAAGLEMDAAATSLARRFGLEDALDRGATSEGEGA
ncbi:MAG: hypothetical protein K1X94_09975 [Sandaracinaceae bacterium]|nr:hypothetical protein [Sandaracinaceae bacterium]